MSASPEMFGVRDARRWIAVPSSDDDKYSRGVVGFVTGSDQYPGAAVVGVEAALRTGVGMVRYLGPPRATELVLARRPEAVPVDGRVQAWVLGSGQDASELDEHARRRSDVALGQPVVAVLDSGALALTGRAAGPVVITPHAGELATLLGIDRAEVLADPAGMARRVAAELGVTVLLKGHTTHVANPGGELVSVVAPTTWLATAGSGDALAGILGALAATHADQAGDPSTLARLAATAVVLHGLAGERASAGGPFTILDLCEAVPSIVADLLA